MKLSFISNHCSTQELQSTLKRNCCLHWRLLTFFLILAGVRFTAVGQTETKSRDATDGNVPGSQIQLQGKATHLPVLKEEPTVTLEAFIISAGEPMKMEHSIDRIVYNLGTDLLSQTGSVSEVLQNIPSLAVDIEGNVSLRGSESVMILIDGKSSSLMGANRAIVLQQIPASEIERIEVITNPSAKYKPDGTSGIINLVMKKNLTDQRNGATLSLIAGNDDRLSINTLITANRGNWGLFGSYSFRLDDRYRHTDDARLRSNSEGDPIRFQQRRVESYRPISHIFRTGVEYAPDESNQWELSGSINSRRYDRNERSQTTEWTGEQIRNDYDRFRSGYETEIGSTITSAYHHRFQQPGHELHIEFQLDREDEKQVNRFHNTYRFPSEPDSFDNTLVDEKSEEMEFTVDYTHEIAEGLQFEVGYAFLSEMKGLDYQLEVLDSLSSQWIFDSEESNHFIYHNHIHAFYATLERQFGDLGCLVGLRSENSKIDSELVTTGVTIPNDYFKVYPSLHLDYDLSENNKLFASYSHRVNRPDEEDLNPFAMYKDPYNLRVGNPKLKPADIHSIELGHSWENDNLTLRSTLFHRISENEITSITEYIDQNIQLTTKTNLNTSSSTGLELALSGQFASWISLNASVNGYRNEIDASNIGFSSKKSITAWSSKISSTIALSPKMMLQVNANYYAKRLKPQGYRMPSWIMNIGLRRELIPSKAYLILTVSDVFDSRQEKTTIDSPDLQSVTLRKRSPRTVYLGVTYHFGQEKRPKYSEFKFDESI